MIIIDFITKILNSARISSRFEYLLKCLNNITNYIYVDATSEEKLGNSHNYDHLCQTGLVYF